MQLVVDQPQPSRADTSQRPPKAKLAYLLAASHSGSTLLAMLLGAQKGACSAGELKATSLGDARSYRCSCRQPICECPFWQQVSAAMADRGVPAFDITNAGTNVLDVPSGYARRLLQPLHRGPWLERVRDCALTFSPAWHRRLATTNHRNQALIESLLSVTGSQVVVDSSKLALRLKYLLRNPALDIRVIRCIRDGRAVAMTYMDDWNFADASDPTLRGGGSGSKRPPPRRNMAEAATEWKRSQEANTALIATLPPSQWTEVRYEELCADPEKILRRLLTFLDLDPNAVILDFRARQQHVIGNGMRFDTTSAIKLDERWRNHLSAVDLATFDSVAGDLNRAYGYQ